ncbi:uncharacterized protein LOC125814723 [Solanum verrucosum]|uniref:uncharacterized protein LOC125814723 n=1 Tax=Solanum verrucosum TaxID=315347 RepID=UPI0020D19D79|nr:uncharacterized protein LOC125814723 [Solanum verrucosum]
MRISKVATSNFSLVNLFGEGTRVFVYRADIPHGKEEQFMEVMRIASTLKHPIVSLVSYSVGHGNHFLVYECIRNVTLDDALNHVVCMPLTWSLRIHIARALNSKPEGEQSVVEWASSKLHDSESLLEMADPTIRRTSSTGVPSSSEGTISQGTKTEKREDKKEIEVDNTAGEAEIEVDNTAGNVEIEVDDNAGDVEIEVDDTAGDVEIEVDDNAGDVKIEVDDNSGDVEIEVDDNAGDVEIEVDNNAGDVEIEVDDNAGDVEVEVDNNAGGAGREQEGEVEQQQQQQSLQIEVANNVDDAGGEEKRPNWLSRYFPIISFAAFGI